MPDATGLELTAQELQEAIPSSIVGTEFHRGRTALVADPAKTHGDRVGTWLKNHRSRSDIPARPGTGCSNAALIGAATTTAAADNKVADGQDGFSQEPKGPGGQSSRGDRRGHQEKAERDAKTEKVAEPVFTTT